VTKVTMNYTQSQISMLLGPFTVYIQNRAILQNAVISRILQLQIQTCIMSKDDVLI